jgi:hypothetical protein
VEIGFLCNFISACIFGRDCLFLQYSCLYFLCIMVGNWLIVDVIVLWKLLVASWSEGVSWLQCVKSGTCF